MVIRSETGDWGTVEIQERAREVCFSVQGALTPSVWRVWGIRDGKEPLLIGVPEPSGGKMVLRRTISKSYLARCGYWPILPERYAAGERFADADGRTASSAVTERERADVRCLTCRFDPNRPFDLAYAFSVCTVKNGTATLMLDKKTGRPIVPERPDEKSSIT